VLIIEKYLIGEIQAASTKPLRRHQLTKEKRSHHTSGKLQPSTPDVRTQGEEQIDHAANIDRAPVEESQIHNN
jgi:hypothetical protein